MRRFLSLALASLAAPAALAADAGTQPAAGSDLLPRFEKRVTEHVLANGWKFLVVEDHDAPVVSFFTHVNVGSAQERYGITGLAHMFEHMAFKGTDVIGTRDAKAEAEAIRRIEETYLALKAERARVEGADPKKVADAEAAFQKAQEDAARFVVENEFGEIIERAGGTGLNAFTSTDQTGYFFALPANKLELWAYLESERFLRPVFRDFYKERDVVKEERRMRTESQPTGRLFEEFLGAAFKAHPYGHPVVGHMSDLDSFTMTDAEEFYRRHYVPANMVTTIVGDVKPAEVVRTLETYFGRVPKAPEPEPLRTVEPAQSAERRVTLYDKAQPMYLEGYHIPPVGHPDSIVLDAVSEILGRGRTSRLYRDMVRDKRIAAQVQANRGFPGDKYPTLFMLIAVPTPGHTADEMGEAIEAHLARLAAEPPSDEELRQVKSRAKADLVRNLSSAQGLSFQLGIYEAVTGDWRNLFRDVERLDAVTAADVQRVAKEYFKPSNRTVAMIASEQTAK